MAQGENNNVIGAIAIGAIAFFLWRLLTKKSKVIISTEPAKEDMTDQLKGQELICENTVYKPLSGYGPFPANLLGKGWCYRGDGSFFDNQGLKTAYGDKFADEQAQSFSEAKQIESVRAINKKVIQFRLINSTAAPITTKVLETTQDSTPFNPPSATSGTITDIDGNTYNWITIGTQQWLVENLKTIHYNNGDLIPEVTGNAAWAALATGAWCKYNNDAANLIIYGCLYNFSVAADVRGIAPTGWRVANKDDWDTLVSYLGGNGIAGGKLKEAGTAHWTTPNTGATNETGFTALASGRRNFVGVYNSIGTDGVWWSSTEYSLANAWMMDMEHDTDDTVFGNSDKKNGCNIRCMRDV